ncbi:Berberine bridge enzyme-like 26 [Linum grandiflorum]
MKISTSAPSLLILLLLLVSVTDTADNQSYDDVISDFLHCLYPNSTALADATDTVVFPSNYDTVSFSAALNFLAQNKRFQTSTTPTPLVIIKPTSTSDVGHTVICAKANGLQLRVRSGGHDYEGLSYVSPLPFVLLDLLLLSDVTVDATTATAWILSGATVGQVYFQVGQVSSTLAFAAGISTTVGIGGQLSGGGSGTLLRYAGLAADRVTDVAVVDPQGKIQDRASLGEDVFWAVRGGGGNTFGVVLAWKVDLVPVPEIVTVVSVPTYVQENHGKQCLATWQRVAATLPDELFIRVVISKHIRHYNNGSTMTSASLTAVYNILYVGRSHEAISVLRKSFPELGVAEEDLLEMSWLRSTLYFADFGTLAPTEALVDRTPIFAPRRYVKCKSDYVTETIPESGWEGVWKRMLQDDVRKMHLILTPYGGRMAKIPETRIPFPHRGGNLFEIQYLVSWRRGGEDEADRHMRWIRELYDYMGKYVSSHPRRAYVNFRDLDIGANNPDGITTYNQSIVWGEKYFNKNFDRLVRIKTTFDPTNYFSNEQSIPSVSPLAGQNQYIRRKNRAPAAEGNRDFQLWSYIFLFIFSLLW